MLRTVLFTFSCTPAYITQLTGNLTNNKIFCRTVSVRQASDLSYYALHDISLTDCLIITDNNCIIDFASQHNITCLAYAKNSTEIFHFPKADMVTEGFEEIDYAFLTRLYLRSHHLPLTIAETSEIILKELPLSDLPRMYEICHKKEILPWVQDMPADYETEVCKHQAYITNVYEFYDYGYWGIYLKDSMKLIGKCGLQNRDTPFGTEVELGYLIDPCYQSRGYCYAAAKEALNYAFHVLDLPSVIAVIDVQNSISIKVAVKLGFQLELQLDGFLYYRINNQTI